MAAALPAMAAAAVSSAGAQVYQGVQADRAQRRSLTAQQEAQKLAEARALSQQKQNEMEFNKANRKQPDIGALLAGEQAAALGGAGSTTLTGAGGVPKTDLLLGKTSLLGG